MIHLNCNTEGSRNFMQQMLARKNQKLFVTTRQEEILIGSLLGDAYITKKGKIQLEQSFKQKEYLFWKYNELSSISYEKISLVKRLDKRLVREYLSYRFGLVNVFGRGETNFIKIIKK